MSEQGAVSTQGANLSWKDYLAGAGLVLAGPLCLFSLWAEWGPYEWVARVQLYFRPGYEKSLAALPTIVFFILVGLICFAKVSRGAESLVDGVITLGKRLIILDFILTVYFVGTGGSFVDGSSFDRAIKEAGFLPRNIKIARRELPGFDSEHASSIATRRGGRQEISGLDQVYLPFERTVWPESGLPVILKTNKFNLPSLQPPVLQDGATDREKLEYLRSLAKGEEFIEGTISKAPIPLLARLSWETDRPLLAVVIEQGDSVRWKWGFHALLFALVGFVVLWDWVKEKFRSAKILDEPPAS